MLTRVLNKVESKNLLEITRSGIETTLVYLTETGLRKSIIDATAPLRKLCYENGYHDYGLQGKGPSNKIIKKCVFFLNGKGIDLKISLYRPVTKNGDPRFWISNLNTYASKNETLAVFFISKSMYITNISKNDYIDFANPDTEFSALLNKQNSINTAASKELLELFRNLAMRPLRSVCEGSTAIGRTIETYLGIKINSKRDPDFKGIEIKSKRKKSSTRGTLFAKVPDWEISNHKSSRSILEKYGYLSGSDLKLYCTIKSGHINPQGLTLSLIENEGILKELYNNAQNTVIDVCAWRLQTLHDSLNKKHKETFWVEASEVVINNVTYFKLENIRHTRAPSTYQFDRLVHTGEITVDHLINIKNGKCIEKGPLFKILTGSVDELFLGMTQEYDISTPYFGTTSFNTKRVADV